MLSWEEIVQKYIARYSDNIRQVTSPVREHFGIKYFSYHKIDLEGRYTVLVDRPDWAEHYVSNRFFESDPYLRHPDVYETGICYLEDNGSKHYMEKVFKDGRDIFDLDFGLIVIEKSSSGAEFFSFSGKHNNSNLKKLLLNHLPLLKAFNLYFKQELGAILQKMEEEAPFLDAIKGEDFHTQTPIIPRIDPSLHLNFLRDLRMGEYIQKSKLLSRREKECLKLLLKGKTAKEIAAALIISPRTVESYLENCKVKLNCWSRSEIIDKAIILNNLSLL